MIITSLNDTHFLVDGKRYPRAYVVQAYDPDDAFLAALAPTGKSFAVPLGSSVGGVTPADQDALIAALAPLVTGTTGGGTGGGSGDGGVAQDYDTEGNAMPNGMPTALGYTNGVVTTLTKTDGVDTWVTTLSYTDGEITNDSGWVKS